MGQNIVSNLRGKKKYKNNLYIPYKLSSQPLLSLWFSCLLPPFFFFETLFPSYNSLYAFVPCSSSDVSKRESNKDLFKSHHDVSAGDAKSGGHILRHFFDDWPRSLQESDNVGANASSMNYSTSLSISMPGNLSSDVSLKLSTGDRDRDGDADGDGPTAQHDSHVGLDNHPQLGWAAAWGSSPMASMGGPLAEALRSSNSNSSPTSVLHQLPRGSASETCIVGS